MVGKPYKPVYVQLSREMFVFFEKGKDFSTRNGRHTCEDLRWLQPSVLGNCSATLGLCVSSGFQRLLGWNVYSKCCISNSMSLVHFVVCMHSPKFAAVVFKGYFVGSAATFWRFKNPINKFECPKYFWQTRGLPDRNTSQLGEVLILLKKVWRSWLGIQAFQKPSRTWDE